MKEPLHVTPLLTYEFRQSLRFQVWRRATNRTSGLASEDARAALDQFDADITGGTAMLVPCSFVAILGCAEDLSRRHAITGGHRSFDVLHVASALHLGAKEFLTFDSNQRKLALAEGLAVKP
jgi:predicted nucleic acid-binding protein